MSDKSTIEWTDATWNPVRGCTKISPGCTHCYAETFAERFRGVDGHPYEQGFDLRLVPDKLTEPLHWKKPRKIFVNSMSDLFHESIPVEYIAKVFAVMELAYWHTYQILTKRAARMEEVLSDDSFPMLVRMMGWDWLRLERGYPYADGTPWHRSKNIIPGVSVENRRHGLPRIEHLRRTPAAVRMLSVEPLLEDLGQIDLTGIGWVITGGESGAGARPAHPDWFRRIRDSCQAQGVPFFHKQNGEWLELEAARNIIGDDDKRISDSQRRQGGSKAKLTYIGKDVFVRVGKHDAGRVLDGMVWDQYPAVAKAVPT